MVEVFSVLLRYALLLSCQSDGILLDVGVGACKSVTLRCGLGKSFGTGWLPFHGYLRCTQAFSHLGYACGVRYVGFSFLSQYIDLESF